MSAESNKDVKEVVRIVSAAEGELVGKTRLQKTAYLLTLAGLIEEFPFRYGNYGPYSEKLSSAVSKAHIFFKFRETSKLADWGGTYSVFSSEETFGSEVDKAYTAIVSLAKNANPIALQLASTAAFLADGGSQTPWEETARRKPEKARQGMIDRAKHLYAQVRKIQTPTALPDI